MSPNVISIPHDFRNRLDIRAARIPVELNPMYSMCTTKPALSARNPLKSPAVEASSVSSRPSALGGSHSDPPLSLLTKPHKSHKRKKPRISFSSNWNARFPTVIFFWSAVVEIDDRFAPSPRASPRSSSGSWESRLCPWRAWRQVGGFSWISGTSSSTSSMNRSEASTT